MLEVAQADAGIACWESKYLYEYWRPIGGIREAATDANPDTTSISDWEPLGAPGGGPPRDFTPPFPAYPSGHATFGAAIFRILELICGSDDVTFTVVSEEIPAAPRTFSSSSKAPEENARSRIFLGVHWDFDDIQGRAMGRKVADQLFSSRFTPVLHVQPRKDHLDIAWPAGAKSYRVKYSADLQGSHWLSMDMAPVVNGLAQFVSVPMAEIGFYKLGMQVR
ncbi:MAG: phosphatase PAP2 family protein [Pedosphaera sp.]|nr:phosphatase PAP2 family protein [Pedosphaera sp.]